jgi:hypothetical protein
MLDAMLKMADRPAYRIMAKNRSRCSTPFKMSS